MFANEQYLFAHVRHQNNDFLMSCEQYVYRLCFILKLISALRTHRWFAFLPNRNNARESAILIRDYSPSSHRFFDLFRALFTPSVIHFKASFSFAKRIDDLALSRAQEMLANEQYVFAVVRRQNIDSLTLPKHFLHRVNFISELHSVLRKESMVWFSPRGE